MANADSAGKTRIPTRLSAADTFKLACLVRDEYATSGKSDREFAEHAASVLGRPVSESSVSTARETFGIPSRREVAAQSGSSPELAPVLEQIGRLQAALASTEARVAKLETKVAILIAFAERTGKTSGLAGLSFSLRDAGG